ncbi:DNA recombination protein RmuC [Limobrevibacterium gyesilva]|uniref:DNA recombination protein RmuC homolog n=1 Tax=Limobrevibacterium gyesilva TaxID=2991712 RepID=A0AA41YNB5_9PROT|nr:DNA recombination protein RmuC [Limobrevibacterium gyesilva]MCW3477051.1 DNA recombination protein RmuC [Limobrevibacterium gyesilva]
MPFDSVSLLAAGAALLALATLVVVLRQGSAQSDALQRLRLLAEQALASQRSEAETLRATLAETERALTAATSSAGGQLRLEVLGALGEMRTALDTRLRELRDGNEARLAAIQNTVAEQLQAAMERQATAGGQLRVELTTAIADMRTALDLRLREMREGNEAKLAEIQKTVNEQLHEAVEKQMTTSFARVTEQFAAVQKAMGDVQAVTAQIGDIKRLFGNVKTRGGWGETQVRAMLDDVLPAGAYETNWKPRPDSDDTVEFAVIMPMRGPTKVRLPVDAKFPVEDYERILEAADAGDAEAERVARRALEKRVRDEAKKLAAKYINPPATVEFAVMYLPTDGLYAEIARMPGLIDDLGRSHRVLVLGPSLFPALLRTIHLGHVTLALEQKADEIGKLLGATRNEMMKIDDVLERLGKQAGTFSTTIEKARVRTRAVGRVLRGVEAIDAPELLTLDNETEDDPETA